jgi:hypothetical protein
MVEKTAETSFEREHLWDIDKMVETENEHELDGCPRSGSTPTAVAMKRPPGPSM